MTAELWNDVTRSLPGVGTHCECIVEGDSHIYHAQFQQYDPWSFAWSDDGNVLLGRVVKWRAIDSDKESYWRELESSPEFIASIARARQQADTSTLEEVRKELGI